MRLNTTYAALGLVACVAYLAAPPSVGAEVLYLLIATSTPTVAFLAYRRDRPRLRIGWVLLIAGTAADAVGEAVFFVVERTAGSANENTAVSAGFIVGSVLQIGGLLSLVQARSGARNRSNWLDAGAVGFAATVVCWSTLYADTWGAPGESLLARLVALAEPTLGIALFTIAFRFLIGERRWGSGLGWLAIAVALQTAGDVLSIASHDYQTGGSIDTLWALGYVLIGCSLAHPRRLAAPAKPPSELARREISFALALQSAVVLTVFASVAIELRDVAPRSTLAAWLVAGVVLLIVNRVRIYGLFRLMGDASAIERARQISAVFDHAHDVIGVIDADGRVRQLSASVHRITGRTADEVHGERIGDVFPGVFDGRVDLAALRATTSSGTSERWMGVMSASRGREPSTLSVELANHLATPEICGWVIAVRDVTDEARLAEELRHLALHDPLTQLPNRTLLFDRIEQAIERHDGAAASFAVILIDLDDFKTVNDSLGHDAGDVVLTTIADRLAGVVGHGNTVARLGGDEFAVVLERTDAARADRIAARLLAVIQQPMHVEGTEFEVSASAGVVIHGGSGDPIDLIRSADIAMYAAKHEGKGRRTWFQDEMLDRAQHQMTMRAHLARAIERDELSLVYQPIVDLDTGAIAGVEALVRWQHPEFGPIPPNEFVPIAEQSGMITAIGRWVLDTACLEAARWQVGDGGPYLSVNVSVPQVEDQTFARAVRAALDASGLPAMRLVIELTESVFMSDNGNARATLAELAGMGVRVAIDDFGTGYSSLAYLRELHVDVLKIDRAFVADVHINDERRSLVRTMLAMADGLGVVAVAEGVETEAERDALIALGCTFAQGYCFSRPVSPAAMAARFVDEWRASTTMFMAF